MNKISVIVPVYGTEKYIEKCLTSILCQSYTNLEVLVVNDSSIDLSKNTIFHLATNDSTKNIIDKYNLACENDFLVRVDLNTVNGEKTIYLSIKKEMAVKYYFSIFDELCQLYMVKHDYFEKNIIYSVNSFFDYIAEGPYENSEYVDEVCISLKEDSFSIRSKWSRLVYIEHFSNKGLYQARLTGYEYSKGDYITTVDSDDYLGVDFLRLLVEKMMTVDADVVVSEMVRVNLKTGYKGKRTHGMTAIREIDLKGEEIIDYLLSSGGELSPMWFVWGKLYKKKLWDDCYEDLKLVNGHHIMLEDLMYGIVFTINSSRYVYCDADTYFYTVNESASTANNGTSDKLIKNITDVLYAFNHIEDYLDSKGLLEKYKNKLLLFREKWSRTWYEIQNGYRLDTNEKTEVLDKLMELSPSGKLVPPTEKDVFFYQNNTPWDERIELLKKQILKKDLISFDIFDTLLLRPFYKPSDIFMLMNEEFKRKTNSRVNFSDMRINAEKLARKDLKNSGLQFEEITLTNIYKIIEDVYGVSESISKFMQEIEIELELKFCYPRKKLHEIYAFAKYLNKRVVFTSDMYLSKEVIVELLQKNGYVYENNLYLSSDLMLTKATGHLYQRMLEEEKISPDCCLHIGDNWQSDCEKAKSVGINGWYTAKPIDLFMNKVSDIDHGKHRGKYGELLSKNLTGSFFRYSQTLDYFGIRCMVAIIANKIYDNPYGDWEKDTDFNRNPYNIGYMALGMHDYGIARWLIKSVSKKSKIFFVARDGYLAMRIYEIIKCYEDIPEYDYFYMSRKSFLPLSIVNKDDWWGVKDNINYIGKTPGQLLEYYTPILPQYTSEKLISIFAKYGIILDVPLSEEQQYINFIRGIQNELHNQELISKYRSKMKYHLTKIFKAGDVMFDIGYSGRAQAILSGLLGYGINAFYIHTLTDKSNVLSRDNDFEVQTFYDYSPALTGKIRELVQSEPTPSCIGYDICGEELKPIFEKDKWEFHEKFVISQMHRGAMDFVRDFMKIFHEYIDIMTYRKTDISFIHEKFLLLPRKADMEVFELFHFEDELFFNKDYEEKWLVDIWNGDLKWNNFPNYKFNRKQNNILVKKEHAADNEASKYEPYMLIPNPPSGIRNKISYFKNNDHIVLKKYMENKNKLLNSLFRCGYGVMMELKHYIKKENAVGNIKADYMLNANGKILYNATSSYGLLCCIVHRLTFFPNEQADLMLSSWRKDKYNKVVSANFFDKVIIWSDMKYREISFAMDKVMQKASNLDKVEQEYRFFGIYEKLIPFKISSYKEIIIAGNTMPFGNYLERNEVEYSIIEDGAGLYSDYSLLEESIAETYPLLEQYMLKKYNSLNGGKHCKNIYINYMAQKRAFNSLRTVNFAPVELIDRLSLVQRKKIFNIYDVNEAKEDNNQKVCLLLTYPLAQRKNFTVSEEKMCYALLADIFGAGCDEIHLKAHPDDRTDFSEIEGIIVVNNRVLSELLWYEKKTRYVKAYATVSTSTNNLLCASKKVAFDSRFCDEYKYILRLYVIKKLLLNNAYSSRKAIHVAEEELYKELFDEIVLDEHIINTAHNNKVDYLICKKAKERYPSVNVVISLEKPENMDNFQTIVINKQAQKAYEFLDLNYEYIYISKENDLIFPVTFKLDICGMKMQICSIDI